MAININGYVGASELTDFPVLVSLDPAAIPGFHYDECAAQGADLRFTDADNAVLLSHEIESWNTGGVSRIWVRVPSLVSNRVIRAFWRNAEAGAASAPSVWDAGFRGVWHLAGSVSDATTNANAAVDSGTLQTNGVVAGARAFGGSATLDCGNGVSLNFTNQLTLSAWIKPSAIYGNVVVGKSYAADHVSPYYSWVLYTTGSSLHCRIDQSAGTLGTLTVGQWQHVAATYDGSAVTLFVDGNSVGAFAKTGSLLVTPRDVRIGGRDTTSPGEFFSGSIDEVRISSTARSADWIRAERDTVDVSSFCSFGPVVQTQLPQVSAGGGATNVFATRACLTGELISTGAAPASVWMCWGTADGGTNVGAWAHTAALGVRPKGVFGHTVSELTPETPHVYRCRAVNAYGEAWSSASTFVPRYPRLAVSDAQCPEGDAGATSLLFKVTLSYASSDGVAFHYAASNGTAGASDYAAASGDFTFQPGQTEGAIAVPVNGDTEAEPDEYVCLDVSAVSQAVAEKTRAYGLILDDDRTNALSPIALATDAARGRVYVARQSDSSIGVIDAAEAQLVQAFSVPESPNGVTLSPDGLRLYVAAGGAAGHVYVLDAPSAGTALQTLAAGHTPLSPVVSPDGGTLYVCNRFDDDVSVIRLSDGATLARVAVGRQPHAAALTPDGARLFVAEFLPVGPATNAAIAGAVSVIDTATRTLAKRIALPPGSQSLRGICISADGSKVYVTHVLSRFYAPTTQVLRGWMNTAALSVIDVASAALVNTVLLDDLDAGAANPWGVLCSTNNAVLCVAHAGTHEISVIDQVALLAKLQSGDGDTPQDLTYLMGLRRRLPLKGNGPRGLALIGGRLFAAEYFSDTVGVVDIAPGSEYGAEEIAAGGLRSADEARLGEQNYNDAKLCLQGWQSCASCHPDARADGLNWDLMNDGFGSPKNTKSHVFSMMTPPAMSTGIRTNAQVAVRSGLKYIQFVSQPESCAAAIDAYLTALRPEPSPHLVNGALSESAARGAVLFQSRGCTACHSGEYFADGQKHDIGTATALEAGVLFDTPTLRELWRTAPYLHDGRFATVREVVVTVHASRVQGLAAADIDDLVEYLLSL